MTGLCYSLIRETLSDRPAPGARQRLQGGQPAVPRTCEGKAPMIGCLPPPLLRAVLPGPLAKSLDRGTCITSQISKDKVPTFLLS